MEKSHKEFTIIRVFDASRELVYKAWTDAKIVAKWWGPKGVFTPICDLDIKPGGKINIVMEAGSNLGAVKGMQWPMKGEFIELDKPKKIVFTSNAVDEDKELFKYRTTVTFDEKGGKTTMTVHVVISNMISESEFAVAGMEQGWNSQFDKLVEFIKKEVKNMQIVDKFMMLQIAVSDMPKAKKFYTDKLGLKVETDYRQDDNNWWVALALPKGGITITLTTHHAHMKPGTMTLYFGTSDIAAAHKELSDKDVKVSDIQDHLHGPGSGVKWFNFKDLDGNLIHMEQV